MKGPDSDHPHQTAVITLDDLESWATPGKAYRVAGFQCDLTIQSQMDGPAERGFRNYETNYVWRREPSDSGPARIYNSKPIPNYETNYILVRY